MAMNTSQVCFVLNITTSNGIWSSQNPFVDSNPLLIRELAVIIFIVNLLFFILKPFHQPRFVTDILGGVLIGPSLLGLIPYFAQLFPLRTVTTLETVTNIALDFYIFLVGLDMDITSIRRAEKMELRVAAAGIVIPMSMGIGLFFLTGRLLNLTINPGGCLFWGLTLIITGFPVVSRVLSKLKLIHSDIGRMAMSTAIINDFCSWILMAIVLPTQKNPRNAAYAVIMTVAFILLCIYVVRPTLVKIIDNTSRETNHYNEHYLCFFLVGVVVCSFVTDLSGTHTVVGAFVFGIIMPNKEIRSELKERFEDFVSGIMLPLFIATCGLRIDVLAINDWLYAGIVVILACVCKILSTCSVCYFSDMPFQDYLALGVLMNTKGILALVILNIGWDYKVLKVEDYTVLVVAVVIMTIVVGPTMAAIYRPSTQIERCKGRTIQQTKPTNELRVLACIHGVHNVSGMTKLLAISNTSKNSPLCIFALQLVELTGGSSAMLIVHSSGKTSTSMYDRNNSDSSTIIDAFENLETQNPAAISVQSLTSLSPLNTMHEDVCVLAEDKCIAFIIIPFHKQATLDDDSKEAKDSSSFHNVNINILVNAPCSVGILVDRALKDPDHNVQRLVMLFIGGPDDREALAYAWWMSGQRLVELEVVRFLPRYNKGTKNQSFVDMERQIQLDNEYVDEFRFKTGCELQVSYSERVVENGEDTIAAIREMDHQMIDLYIVGRQVIESPVTAGLADWSDDFLELGMIGDLLASSSFVNGSVLVVQQYAGASGDANVARRNDSVRPIYNIEPL